MMRKQSGKVHTEIAMNNIIPHVRTSVGLPDTRSNRRALHEVDLIVGYGMVWYGRNG